MTFLRAISYAVLLSVISSPVYAEKPSSVSPAQKDHLADIALIETGLRPTYGTKDEPGEAWTLEERMRHYNVPGVSIAVAINGELVWAKAYGVADRASGAPVDTQTVFQAASLSKPVASLIGLALVQDGILSLDRPVNDYLTRWHLPENDLTAQQPVTIRHLMSHRGGTTIHGFRGYSQDDIIPTLPQILAGIAPANTDPVIVNQVPGQGYRYSGGGFTVLQLAIEDASGGSFSELVENRIFYPAEMLRSNFRFPVNDPNAAVGHDGRASTSMAGRELAYPELAAAGMWTTPSELVRLGSLVARARNSGNFVLETELARQLVPADAEMAGLGFGLNNAGDGVAFVHNGHNPGFSARWISYADGRASVAILTNSDTGGDLIREIFSGIGHVYGWQQDAYEIRETESLTALQTEAIVGNYAFGPNDEQPLITISMTGSELWIDGALADRSRLFTESETSYFIAKGLNFEGKRDESGQVNAISVEGEIHLVRIP